MVDAHTEVWYDKGVWSRGTKWRAEGNVTRPVCLHFWLCLCGISSFLSHGSLQERLSLPSWFTQPPAAAYWVLCLWVILVWLGQDQHPSRDSWKQDRLLPHRPQPFFGVVRSWCIVCELAPSWDNRPQSLFPSWVLGEMAISLGPGFAICSKVMTMEWFNSSLLPVNIPIAGVSGLSPEDGMWSSIMAATLCQHSMVLAGEGKYSAREEEHTRNDDIAPNTFYLSIIYGCLFTGQSFNYKYKAIVVVWS